MNKMITTALILLLSIAGGANAAAPEARSERVDFASGATSRVIKGQVKGFAYVDYPLHAGAGQTLSVEMKSSNASNYFNINPPGSEMSLFIGSTSGARFSGVLPVEGDYTVRVYLMRNAARRNESGNYTLTLGLTGQPLMATPAAKDALIPGTLSMPRQKSPARHRLLPRKPPARLSSFAVVLTARRQSRFAGAMV
jgi:hypothetical protein